ncbi:uncharacterized protein LOC128662825 isoform X1 [Bombina bombina]|uniref:uncharacterized protein LOC128657837 n=1 Tax=Bombina bombina TaxID=8345 RepID=UPI00235AD13C|nr:uncharacterized protein LOC128648120 isoform X1 [Bombina bombina]XP_053560327.1 uncharacterized protein LOC128650416 isoform X1 [Bombina bombina]XP_053568234.1 uncharacterized protein LOC128657837 [Bombina bombina]XP_053572780.1 uncharacterized protein LOC128662825 isoform X1 [Bombina bombina]
MQKKLLKMTARSRRIPKRFLTDDETLWKTRAIRAQKRLKLLEKRQGEKQKKQETVLEQKAAVTPPERERMQEGNKRDKVGKVNNGAGDKEVEGSTTAPQGMAAADKEGQDGHRVSHKKHGKQMYYSDSSESSSDSSTDDDFEDDKRNGRGHRKILKIVRKLYAKQEKNKVVKEGYEDEDSSDNVVNLDDEVAATKLLPLPTHLKAKVVRKAQRGRYVDVFEMTREALAVKSNEGRGRKAKQTFPEWVKGMVIYAECFLTANPDKMKGVLRYIHLIAECYTTYGGFAWKDYDREFRKGNIQLGGKGRKDFGVKILDTWTRVMKVPEAQGRPIGQGKTFRTEAKECWAFNDKRCDRGNSCKYKHACRHCGGAHPGVDCRKGNANNNSKFSFRGHGGNGSGGGMAGNGQNTAEGR